MFKNQSCYSKTQVKIQLLMGSVIALAAAAPAFAEGGRFGQSLDKRCFATELKQGLEAAKVAEFATGGKLTASPILLADGDTIVVASEDGALYFLDTKLNLKQKLDIGGSIRNTPLEVSRSKESRGLLFLAADGKTDKDPAEAVLVNPKTYQIVNRKKLTYSHVDSSPIEVAEGFVITSVKRVKERDFQAESQAANQNGQSNQNAQSSNSKQGQIFKTNSDSAVEILEPTTLEPAIPAFKIPGNDIYASPSADSDGLIFLPTVSTNLPGSGVLMLFSPEAGMPVKVVIDAESYSMPYLHQSPKGPTAVILGESGSDGGISIYKRDKELTHLGSLLPVPGLGGVISTASPVGKNLIVIGTGWGELIAINSTRLNKLLEDASTPGKDLEKTDGLVMRVKLSGNLTGSATETSDGSIVIGNDLGELFFLDKDLKPIANFAAINSVKYYGFPLPLSDGSVVAASSNGKVFQVRIQLSVAEPIKVRTRCEAEQQDGSAAKASELKSKKSKKADSRK